MSMAENFVVLRDVREAGNRLPCRREGVIFGMESICCKSVLPTGLKK
jgi:hypothetical protein